MSITEPVDVGLREQLLTVTVDLLARDGIEAVSLREIARRAGVSHSAPLRHFRSLAALLSAVAAQGFRQLNEDVAIAVAACGPRASARDRCVAAIHAYGAFGVANRGHFILMFRADVLDYANDDVLPAGFAAFDFGVERIRAYQAEGWHPDEDPRVLHGAMWAAVHGATLLWVQHSMQGVTGAQSLDQVLDTIARVLLGEPGPRRRRTRR